jgi:hypothetical protein
MGAFYGSIHLRTHDREAVRRILEEVSSKEGCKFWLSPVIGGWISAYPENSGQDGRISKAIAKHFPGEMLHTVVHDDDAFIYLFYCTGKLVDEFNSRPDYFGEVSDKEKKRVRGNPKAFQSLLPEESDRQKLAALLESDEAFAGDLLQRFAELLNLSNALSSYEYLEDEEMEIQGWNEFIHIPDRTKEQQEAQAVENRAAGETRQQKEQGILLMDCYDESKERAVCCPEKGGGFFICRGAFRPDGQDSIDSCRAPWDGGPNPTGLFVPSTMCTMRVSLSGRYLAAGHAFGNWFVQLWDITQRNRLFEVAHAQAVNWVDFTSDETTLLSASSNELFVTSISQKERVGAVSFSGGARCGAVHPSGSHAVIGLQEKLVVVDLQSLTVIGTLCCGGCLDRSDMNRQMSQMLAREFAKMDAGRLDKKTINAFKKLAAITGENVEDVINRQVEESRRHVEQLSRPDPGRDLRGTESLTCVDFSSDGRQMFCATDHGVRVYDWSQVQVATNETPAPVLSAEAEPVFLEGESHKSRYTYALARDDAGRKLLFGGMEGKVSCLDLQTGQASVLVDLTARNTVMHLYLSSDRAALCSVTMPPPSRGKRLRKRPAHIQIWDYQKLIESAGKHSYS